MELGMHRPIYSPVIKTLFSLPACDGGKGQSSDVFLSDGWMDLGA